MPRDISNPTSLMEPDLSDVARWGAGAAQWSVHASDGRSFRIRGFTSYRALTKFTATKLGGFVGEMERVRRTMPGWTLPGFDWDENFAPAQINAAMKMKLLRFDKAAKVLLVCVVAARSQRVADAQVLESMRIEPAAFGLLSFDESYVKQIEQLKPGFGLVSRLADECAQPRSVIEAMTRRHPVTYRLARAVEQFCRDQALVPGPGAIVQAWGSPWKEPCHDEIVSGLSDPAENTAIRQMFNGAAA